MRKETEEWLRIAYEEHQSAHILMRESLYRMVCYHAEQTVEKLLKAILSEGQMDFPRTHNLLDLRNSVQALGRHFDLTDEEAVFLNSVYRARYPMGLGLLPTGDPTTEEAAKAMSIAEKSIKSVESIFSINQE